jgi:hypothetical protein
MREVAGAEQGDSLTPRPPAQRVKVEVAAAGARVLRVDVQVSDERGHAASCHSERRRRASARPDRHNFRELCRSWRTGHGANSRTPVEVPVTPRAISITSKHQASRPAGEQGRCSDDLIRCLTAWGWHRRRCTAPSEALPRFCPQHPRGSRVPKPERPATQRSSSAGPCLDRVSRSRQASRPTSRRCV